MKRKIIVMIILTIILVSTTTFSYADFKGANIKTDGGILYLNDDTIIDQHSHDFGDPIAKYIIVANLSSPWGVITVVDYYYAICKTCGYKKIWDN